MFKSLGAIFLDKTIIQKWYFWVGLSFCINIFYFNKQIELSGSNPISVDGDEWQYVGSAEKFFQTGEFQFGGTTRQSNFAKRENVQSIQMAYRTPGFAIIYLPCRIFNSQENTLWIIIFIQLAINALSKYLIALIALKILQQSGAFYFCITILNLTPYFSFFDGFFLTESLGLSFLIITVFLFVFEKTKSQKQIILFGFCLYISFLFRPFLGILFPVISFLYLKGGIKSNAKRVVFFMLPLLIFQPVWILRNYLQTNQFVPIASTLLWHETTNKGFMSFFKLTQVTGLNNIFWENDSPVTWFINPSSNNQVPQSLLNKLEKHSNLESSILIAKKKFLISDNKLEPLAVRMSAELESKEIIDSIVAREYVLKGKVWIKINSFYSYAHQLINQPIYRYFVSIKYPLNVLITALEYFIVRFVFYFGLFAAIILFVTSIINLTSLNPNIFLLSFLPVFLMVFFSNMELSEHREIFISYPFSLISTLLFLSKLTKINPLVKYGSFSVFLLICSYKTVEYILTTIKF